MKTLLKYIPDTFRIKNTLLLGVVFAFFQAIAFSILTLLIKLVSDNHHPVDMLLYRNAICTGIVFLFLVFTQRVGQIRKANLKRQGIRAVTGTVGMVLTFVTFSLLPLTEAQSLLFAAPLFVVVLSYPLLKEKVGMYRTMAAVIGFLGVLLILQPGTISSFLGGLVGLSMALAHALVAIVLRWLGKTEDPFVTIFYFSLFSLIVILPFSVVFWTPPLPMDLVLLCMIGVTSFFTQFFLTKAMFLAPVAVVAPVSYFSMLWALLIDLMILGFAPVPMTLAGSALIIGSNLFILWRQNVKKVKFENPPHS